MRTPASILVYGRDPQLVETRALLLRQLGHRVYAANSVAELDATADVPQMDLIVLCHTLTDEDCERAFALIHARWPGIQTLALVVGSAGCGSAAVDAFFDATEGPVKLLQKVERLLGRRQVVQ